MSDRNGWFYRLPVAGVLLALAGCIGWPAPAPSGITTLPDYSTTPGGLLTVPATTSESFGVLLGADATSLTEAGSAPACVETGQPATTIHRQMFEALNLYRIQNGLKPLVYSKRLERAADVQTSDLWERNFFAHVNPDGKDPGARAVDAGFCHRYVGENLAAGQKSVQAAQTAWQNSRSHNENMLEPDYRYVGMGFSVDPSGRMYWAQELAYDLP